jgi:hypothetical protein
MNIFPKIQTNHIWFDNYWGQLELKMNRYLRYVKEIHATYQENNVEKVARGLLLQLNWLEIGFNLANLTQTIFQIP